MRESIVVTGAAVERTREDPGVHSAPPHNLALDGIRGIALLMVLLDHGAEVFLPLTYFTHHFYELMIFGWTGVDLFFVLSGYLITEILLRTESATNRALSFYARRTLRIFPIYYLTLAFIAVAAHYWPWLQQFVSWGTGFDYAMYVLYLQNWLPLIHWNRPGLNIFGHFWSLGVEEQFYLLWPWILWKLPKRFLLPTCIYGILASLLLRIVLVAQYKPQYWLHSITPARGSGLLVGAALAVLAANGQLSRRVLGLFAITGFTMTAFIAVVHHVELFDADAGPYMSTIGHLALPLLFGALVGSSRYSISGLTQVCTFPFLRTLGKYSYGFYVYHVPIYILVLHLSSRYLGTAKPEHIRYAVLCFVAAFLSSFALAWLSYNFLEMTAMSYKDRFKPVFAGRGND